MNPSVRRARLIAFARASVDCDLRACALAETQFDSRWTGEHTDALAEHLGVATNKLTLDEIALAEAEYRRRAKEVT